MEKEAKVFKYERPEFDGVKKSMLMCSSDLMRVHVQVVKSGGENNLHTHTGEDAFWLVLNGAVRFYGEGDKVTRGAQEERWYIDSARLQILVRKRQR
jgi:quercetin dioxygenase-like cupin family protein